MKILLFAHLRKIVGKSEIEIEFPKQADVEEFWRRLLSLHPELSSQRSQVRLAVNSEFTSRGTLFENSDEVALIPPVSGG